MTTIRIIACPPGEAPQAVREAWIGLELPLPPGRGNRRRAWRSSGVLTGPRLWWQQLIRLGTGRAERNDGYVVNALEAVNALALKSPDAAGWWREQCPHMLTGRRYFVFAAECCKAHLE